MDVYTEKATICVHFLLQITVSLFTTCIVVQQLFLFLALAPIFIDAAPF